MSDLVLRIVVSLSAAAMVRMLTVFGLLPLGFAVILLGVIGAAMSKGLKATRFAVVLATSASYFLAWYFTQPPAAEAGLNPEAIDLVKNSLEVFAPFLTPVIGSGIMLAIEKQRTAEPAEEEITEESLLAEKLPELPARDLYYDLSDSE